MIYYSSQLSEADKQRRTCSRRTRKEEAVHGSDNLCLFSCSGTTDGTPPSDEKRTEETIRRMSEVIAAAVDKKWPVCLTVTGDDLGESCVGNVIGNQEVTLDVSGMILRYRGKEFIQAASQCQSVLFCRVSATQKRELVTVAKGVFKHRILAIGDGANDVGMIRESHCGVAVYGREGSQAVAAGDFAVDRFECLRRLLLVHGAWCFTRTSELILYTFMHNCAYVFVIFYHQMFNGYSGAVSLHSICKS